MGRGRRSGTALVTAIFMSTIVPLAAALAACTTQQDIASEGTHTAYGRLVDGEPLVACTIKGEYPVHAEASALCGTLRVPEDRSKPDGRQIALRIAVVPALASRHAPEPLFVLAGGPGAPSTQFFAWLPSVFAEVHASRDIVLVDQRGTGASNALEYPAVPDTHGLSPTAANTRLSAWAGGALAAIDGDPRFYTSTVAADDIDDVRAALGYEQIDLYGTSYGGTLVQYYLRQHADRVRVAVLDGSTPVDVPVLERMAASSQAALDLLFKRCAADPACHEAFPRLANDWTTLLNRLAKPLTVVDPASGDTAVIDQALLANAIHLALLNESTAAQVPLGIHLASLGRWVDAADVIGAPPSGGPTLVMADEILCSEAWARLRPAEVARLGRGSYSLPMEQSNATQREAKCRYLPKGAVSPGDGAAVRTRIPVLWLVGDGDPQDPPSNLSGVPAQQPNSRIVVMPAQQHVVGQLGCMPSVIAAFLSSASAIGLNTSCVAKGSPAPPFRLR
ncbi:alpha/beta fold hydrolase [Intrasporangium mesophilum]